MAIFYGHDSDFIKGKQKSRGNMLALLLLFIVVVSIALFFLFRHYWYVSPLALLLGIGLSRELIEDAVKDAHSTFWWLLKKKGQADRGMLGERIVKQKLEALPDTYSVFRGFRPYQTNDVDFVVIGPNGVFSIEVKSQTGKITFERRSYGNRLLWQARKEALEMHRYFAEGWKIKTYVTGILAFARSGVKIPDMEQPVNSVYVVKGDNVVPTILNHRGTNTVEQQIKERLGYFYKPTVG